MISAFHFAVQLERSHFQIHPHTAARKERERENERERVSQRGEEYWGELSWKICKYYRKEKRRKLTFRWGQLEGHALGP